MKQIYTWTSFQSRIRTLALLSPEKWADNLSVRLATRTTTGRCALVIVAASVGLASITPTSAATPAILVQTNCIFANGTTNSAGCPGGSVTPVLTTVVSNRTYTLTAKPAAGWSFAGWSGGVTTSNPALKILLQSNITVVANFTERPFNPVKGNYYGVFNPASSSNAVTTVNSGTIVLTVTDLGLISGKLIGVTESYVTNIIRKLGTTNTVIKTNYASTPLAFTGRGTNDTNGNLSVTLSIPRPKKQPLQVTGEFIKVSAEFDGIFALDDGRPELITLYRAQSFSRRCPFAGTYTATLASNNSGDPVHIPPGYGAFTVKVGTNGSVLLSGTLSDGTPITQGSFVGGTTDLDPTTGYWPLYVPLNQGMGMVHGLISFTREDARNSFGADPVYWIRPGKTGPITRLATELAGLEYHPPGRGTNVVLWTNGIAMFEDGNLNSPLTSAFTLNANNRVSVLNGNSNKLALTFAPATGLFSGSVLNSTTRRSTPFKGVVIQTPASPMGSQFGGYAAGWFLGTNEFGSVFILELLH